MPRTVSDRTRIVSQEAAYWYIRCCDERAMLLADRQLFVAWLKYSPENVAELLRISEVDGKVAQQRLLDVVSGMEESNVYDINSGGVASQYDYNPSDSVSDERIVKTKNRPAWALAAMIGAIAVTMFFGFAMIDNRADGQVQTAASQWQQMTLEDGSSVHMDARTRLKVEYTDTRRLVHLVEGQSVFQVAKDSKRPFTVRTHLVDVTAIGTRFGVAIEPGVTTTVSEGVVRVTPHEQPNHPAAVHLNAGEQLQVLATEEDRVLRRFGFGSAPVDLSMVAPIKVDAVRKLGWAVDGWVRFDGETIREMVNEFNRRNVLQIVIEDGAIADRRPLGSYDFRLDKPDSFVKALDSQEGITMIQDGEDVLRLKAE